MNSEIEEYVNTITATMTKLRAHIRKLGMAGTEPKCTCVSGVVGDDCPLHSIFSKPDADLPLRARVAQLVGWDEPDELTTEWAMGALEEHCKQVGQPAHIVYNPDPVTSMGNKAFHVEINFKGRFGDTLPRAICEAIAKHAETQ